jgi:hypothetical protein
MKALVPADEVHRLKDSDFAVKVATASGEHRKFPTYNKVACAFSGLYFDKVAGELPEQIRKIAGFHLKAALKRFGLEEPESLAGEFPAVSSNLVVYSPEPEAPSIRTGEAVLKLAEYSFLSHHRRMSAIEKVAKAIDIAKAAEMAKLPVESQEIWDYTPKDQLGPHFESMLRQREVAVAGNEIMKTAFAEVVATIPKTPANQVPFLVHEFDKVAGFDYRYGLGGFLDPFYGTWGGCLRKEASVEVDVLKYKLGTLSRGPGGEAIKATFGEPVASKFLRDPVGTYGEMGPEEKKFIDFMLKYVPSKIEEDPSPSQGPGQKRKKSLWDDESAAKEGLKKSTKPSDRPNSGGEGMSRGATAVIQEGL